MNIKLKLNSNQSNQIDLNNNNNFDLGEGLYEVHRCTVSRDTVCEPCVSRRRPERSGKCSVFLLQLQQQQEHRHQEEVNEDEEDEDDDEEEDDANAGSVPSTTQRSSTLSDVDGPLRLPENNASEDLSLLGLYRSGIYFFSIPISSISYFLFHLLNIFYFIYFIYLIYSIFSI